MYHGPVKAMSHVLWPCTRSPQPAHRNEARDSAPQSERFNRGLLPTPPGQALLASLGPNLPETLAGPKGPPPDTPPDTYSRELVGEKQSSRPTVQRPDIELLTQSLDCSEGCSNIPRTALGRFSGGAPVVFRRGGGSRADQRPSYNFGPGPSSSGQPIGPGPMARPKGPGWATRAWLMRSALWYTILRNHAH